MTDPHNASFGICEKQAAAQQAGVLFFDPALTRTIMFRPLERPLPAATHSCAVFSTRPGNSPTFAGMSLGVNPWRETRKMVTVLFPGEEDWFAHRRTKPI
jgi:hypothetical protein